MGSQAEGALTRLGSGPAAPLRHSCPLLRPLPYSWSLHAFLWVGLILTEDMASGWSLVSKAELLSLLGTHGGATTPTMPCLCRACCLPWADWTTTSWLRLTRCSSKCYVVSVPGTGDVSMALVKPVAHCGKTIVFNCYLNSDPKFNCKNTLLTEQLSHNAEFFIHAAIITLSLCHGSIPDSRVKSINIKILHFNFCVLGF